MKIEEMFEIIESNYNFVEVRDCYDEKIITTLYLNNKHSIEAFQDAINKAKEKHAKDIEMYGDDWSFISEELDEFDYYILGNCDYFVEY